MIQSSLSKIHKKIILVASSAMIATTIFAQAQGNIAPDQVITTLSNDVLVQIKQDKTLQNGNIKKLMALVENKIMPNVDFAKMTASTVGKNWSKATPDEKKKLEELFRALLVRTYSGAVSAVKDYKVTVKPLTITPTATSTIVKTDVVANGRQPIALNYRMQYNGTQWKITDVNVAGIWLVESYRSSFTKTVTESGIAGLIKVLEDKNAALENKMK
jgi:phospholipid transport system substrate-binding protein